MAGAPRKMLKKINDDVEFRQHQVDGVREMLKIGSPLLADEMGLGKSLQALTVAAVEYEQSLLQRLLIVAPTTLKWNWEDEINKFTSFSYTLLDGEKKKRERVLEGFGSETLIVNYEQVVAHLDQLNAIKFDMVIYDEAHYIKSHTSARTKANLKLKANRHLLITGSPLLNKVNELWTLLHRIAPKEFPNYWRFVNRYCVYGGYKDKEVVGTKNQAELKLILATYMVRRLKKDVLDLPDKNYIELRVDMTPEQKKLYKEAKETLRLELPGQPDPMELENGMTRFLRLQQVCSTTANLMDEDHSSKLDLGVERAQEVVNTGKPVVLWTRFRGTNTALVARFAKIGIPTWELHGDVKPNLRQSVVADWTDNAKNGNPGVLVCQLQVAGVGLNMTVADTCIFIDKLFVPKLNEQAEDRIHRIGASTSQPVNIISIITKNSIESRVEKILSRKKKTFDELVETTDFKRELYAALLSEDDDE